MKYDMICNECNLVIEVECKMEDYDKVIPFLQCEKCKSPLKRLLTPPTVMGEIGGYDSVGGKAKWQS